MRKKTEISLVSKRPHLFNQSILNGLGISTDNYVPSKDINDRFRWDYKEDNFFECGEGWLPIIVAFTESLDHFLSEYEVAEKDDEAITEKAFILINGVMRHHHRLCIIIDRTSEYDDAMLSKIRAMQEFSAAMSGMLCEVCGTPVTQAHLDSPVRCTICRIRDL